MTPPPQRPIRAMESAIRRGKWQQAAEFVDAVLAEHGDDAEVIANAARVVFENGDKSRAAELLVRACQAESFSNPARVRQATIAMIGEGRFHEGIELLESAVAANPEQQENRRWLYDFYMGAEDRYAGLPHGRALVRQRAFDVELLTTLSNTERRTLDSKPLMEMAARNPDDKRPMLGAAKSNYDKGDFGKCIEQLREIIEAHPDYLPAQALLGRALATDGRFRELAGWLDSAVSGVEQYPEYWVAVGDWLRSEGRGAEAARAYWEATQRDPDWMETWSKLSSTIESLPDGALDLPDDAIAGIRSRAQKLSRFNLLKTRFERTGGISRATVVEMVDQLRELGRLWEAEAWASIALGLPEDDAVDAQAARNQVVALLSKDTPWQVEDSFPELQVDLGKIPMDQFVSVNRRIGKGTTSEIEKTEPQDRAEDASREIVEASHLSLQDQAKERGLEFHGRTSDHLSEPGIMIYQTLGCGGGTIDFDLDGWSDLYLAAAGGMPPAKDSAPNALMRNLQGQFHEVTTASETGDRGFGQGIAVGDVNEDGFADLLVLNYGPNTLLINNGDGTFSDHTDRLDANLGDGWSSSGAIVDIDHDGLADIAVVNYCAGLDPTTVNCATSEETFVPSCSPMRFDALGDQFLKGTESGSLEDRTESWNASPSVLGRGLGIIAGSFDGAPGVDLLVANDMTNNHYWSGIASSDEGFRLTESGMLRGLATDDRALAQGSMGIATGDLDNDGDFDFYVTNFNGEYNTYHGQQVDGIWRDETSQLELATPTFYMVGFGTAAVDLDRDSSLELLVTNGHVDIFSRGLKQSPYAQPMQLFKRNESQTFSSVAEVISGDYTHHPHVGRALWTLDVNRDAQVDLAVTHQTEPVALLVNQSEPKGGWLEVALVGTSDSRDAIGSRVEVSLEGVSPDGRNWVAAKTSGDGYLCSDERILRFGLGDMPQGSPLRVVVIWPNGNSQAFEGVLPDHSWLFVQDDPVPFQLR